MKWFLQGLRKYAVFAGRSGRREFWFYCLFGYLIGIAIYVIDINVGTYAVWRDTKFGLLCSIYTALLLIPNTSVAVRRLHDVGKTGWWMLMLLLPIVGNIVLTIYWSSASMPGDNVYGPSPTPQRG